jgi:hypothetical protein
VSWNTRPLKRYLTWSVDYIECSGNQYKKEVSLDLFQFDQPSNQLVISPDMQISANNVDSIYNIHLANADINSTELKALPKSTKPKSINGPDEGYNNQIIQLTLDGGRLLAGSKWTWYENSIAPQNKLTTGESCSYAIKNDVILFVRAEGVDDTTIAVQKRVVFRKESIMPKKIIGENIICPGDKISLKVDGGVLGVGAEYVWYEGGCGQNRLNTGSTLEIKPTGSVLYYVRAEGPYGKTECLSYYITMTELSINPSNIYVSDSSVCEGTKIQLGFNEGKISSDAKWAWYRDECGKNPIGYGTSLEISPPVGNHIYYLRAEGKCNVTDCLKSKIIEVNKLPRLPYSINQTSIKRMKVKLSFSTGGDLGSSKNWVWKNNKGIKIGLGNELILKRKFKSQIIHLYSEGGPCNTSYSISTTIMAPVKQYSGNRINDHIKLSHANFGQFLQFGFAAGFDYSNNWAFIRNDLTNDSLLFQINGLGGKFDLILHPIITKNISLQTYLGYALGKSPFAFSQNRDELKGQVITYDYQRFEFGLEFTGGTEAFKGLADYHTNFQSHDYTQISTINTDNTFTYKQSFRREYLKLGIRIGKHGTVKEKNAVVFDLYGMLVRDYESDYNNLSWTYKPISNWTGGIGGTLWAQSIINLKLEMLFRSIMSAPSVGSGINMAFNATIQYNLNFFYTYK